MTQSPLQRRRKPVQERSKLTQDAILEAFVRLLLEKDYTRLTIREIAAVAGVGLGTVYEHFPGKGAIAANCIHQRFKNVGTHSLACIEAMRGQPLAAIADALLDTMVELHAEQPQQWTALIYLERRISDAEAYRSLYQYFVDIWAQAIMASAEQVAESVAESVAEATAREVAWVLHTAVYGMIYQTLMNRPERIATPQFRAELGALVHGYLANRDAVPRLG
ncbi:MAG: TetR/AcrR family transcriptional regulator [Burkholderiaceae bacterium]|nr:TetR/AcrR family transcriptional regulator [Burkholderiaceae bacterium]